MPAPRGIRNRNPGNLVYSSANQWEGLAEPPSDGRFAVFTEDVFGLRALARLLLSYRKKHNLQTIRDIINRWAPPSENDTGSYARAVAKAFGAPPTYIPDLNDPGELETLVRAIVLHENGRRGPFDGDWYPAVTYRSAVEMALRPIGRTRTVQGGVVAGTATTAQGLLSVVQDNVDQAQQWATVFDMAWPEVARYVLLAVALAGIAWTLYARYSDRKAGFR